jgi:RNase P/RNase MRP subunit p29
MKVEELIGRKIKVTMNSQNGIVVITGELIKVVSPFIVMKVDRKITYFSIYSIKSIEEV